jgi:DNA-binding NtrC family response regulator
MQAMSLQDKRVLVVEDEALLAMMLEDVFSDAGAQVVGPAATVEQAIALIASQVIDVALLDVCLRDQRSEPVAETLRQRGVPYVLATGYNNPDGAELASAPTLRKPYRFEQVEAALIAALESKETEAIKPVRQA